MVRRWLTGVLPEEWLSYLLHTRPRAWFIVTAHMTVGFLLATGLSPSWPLVGRWLLAALSWGVLGNGGTLALNSAFDRDDGDIGYLESPPPVPRRLASVALAMLVVGLLVALSLGWRFLIVYVVCAVLAVLYSVPPFRFKARAGLDVLTNASGYGGLTLFAGWAAVAQPAMPPIINVVAAFFCLFVGFYPLTQIYQLAEDARRGDYTMALALGKRNALRVALISVALAFGFLALEVLQRYRMVRAVALLFAVLAWMVVLVPWYRNHRTVDTQYEKRGFYRALYAWALTDIGVIVALIPLV